MKCREFLLFFLAGFFFQSCMLNRESETRETVESWIGREFLISNYLLDSVNTADKDYFLLTYVDSTICSSCRIQAWNEYVKEASALANGKIGCIMIISPDAFLPDIDEFSVRTNYIIDQGNVIKKKNDIPDDDRLRVFLLDRNYKVLCIGNPIINGTVRELFLSYMSDYKRFTQVPYTTVKVEHPVIVNNEFVVDSLAELGFKVKNTGEYPLFIKKIITSCSCIYAENTSDKLFPGDSAFINVSYKPTHSGKIIEKIYLDYNGENSPETMIIKGMVSN